MKRWPIFASLLLMAVAVVFAAATDPKPVAAASATPTAEPGACEMTGADAGACDMTGADAGACDKTGADAGACDMDPAECPMGASEMAGGAARPSTECAKHKGDGKSDPVAPGESEPHAAH